MASSGTTFSKRQKERARQERKQQKQEKRVNRKDDKDSSDGIPTRPGEDPDIAGIKPGPQPPPDWLSEPMP